MQISTKYHSVGRTQNLRLKDITLHYLNCYYTEKETIILFKVSTNQERVVSTLVTGLFHVNKTGRERRHSSCDSQNHQSPRL